MRRNYLLLAGCMVLLSACASAGSGDAGQTVGVEESGAAGESGVSGQERDGEVLTRKEIDTICSQIYSTVYHCGDGSQILIAGISGSYINLRYMPRPLDDGNYSFFRNWTPSYEVTEKPDGSVDIPIHINDSVKASFLVNVVPSVQSGMLELETAELMFINQEDTKFHQMYEAFDSKAQRDYRLSLKPDLSMPKDQLAGFLRACIYNGNFYVLDTLYGLTPADSQEERYKLELAGAMEGEAELTYSAANPYLPEIYYGESCEEFPQREVLEFVAEDVRTGAGLEASGAERLEPNADWEHVYHLPGFQDLYEYVYEDDQVTGVYHYDLDQDGLPEILILFPGGSMGNHFWEVLHLDASGEITATNSGEGLGSVSLYRYQGNYFFVNEIYDYNDREWLGWEVHALDKNDNMYIADIYRERTGAEIVFTDEYQRLDSSYYLEWQLEHYIDKYKAYETEAVGREIEAGEEIQNLFEQTGWLSGTYGVMDFNNDGIDDWTNVYKFFPSGRYPYYCCYALVDGKTKELLDFTKLEDLSYNLRCMFPYSADGKNYVICLLNGYGNYVFKLVELQGMEPVEIQSWLAAVKNRVLVHAHENHGARLGI